MTEDQITGPIRAVAPLLTFLLVSWGLDSQTAALVVSALTGIAMAVWSYFSNKRASMALKVADKKDDVHVVVGKKAPEDLKELAIDPKVTAVIPDPRDPVLTGASPIRAQFSS